MKEYWISCEKFTGGITVDENNIIIEGMPIIRKFIGQPLINLSNWMQKKFNHCILRKIK